MNWYALQTHTSFEERVGAYLSRDCISSYCPTYQLQLRKNVPKAQQCVRRALFPGYLFVKLPDGRLSLAPHIVRVVGYGDDNPIAIPSHEIESVRILESSPSVEPCAFTQVVGQPVYIRKGPMRGVYGTFVKLGGKGRVVVAVTLLASAVSAEVEADWLEDVGEVTLPKAA